MVRVKSRRKSSRFRGSHTHGRGGKKKARGSGHRGGFGMAGSGKRGDQKKTLILKNTLETYFGKRGTKLRFKPRLKTFNLDRIGDSLNGFLTRKVFEEKSGKYSADLKGYKVVGQITTPIKLSIKVSAISETAKESIKKHGGEVEVYSEKEE